jgi:hypothetical protein
LGSRQLNKCKCPVGGNREQEARGCWEWTQGDQCAEEKKKLLGVGDQRTK